jgi:DNA-binding NarL/FixJ family response regulator
MNMTSAELTIQPLRLLLVDDHPVLRAGLKALLCSQNDITVVAEADNGVAAVELALALNPDLTLMDVSLPGMNGADAARKIKEARPELRMLALSVHDETAYVRLLLDAGVSGYALKRSACEELVRAVRSVAAGDSYLDPSIARRMLGVSARRESSTGLPALIPLSERESEVARLLAQGLTMKEIAAQLSVSARTLETYRARALEKLGLKTRAELVRYATNCGWLRPH